MKYRIKKPDSICNDCGAEGVPVVSTTGDWRNNQENEKIDLCCFCYEATGKPDEYVTKRIMSQMLHAFRKERE